MITLRILESTKVIESKISKALIKAINSSITKNKKKVIDHINTMVPTWIYEQPEMQSLQKLASPNELSSLLGLPLRKNKEIIAAIVKSIVDSTVVNITKIDNDFKGKIEFNFQPSNFQNLLSLKEGIVINEKDGTPLHWMDWILMKGNQTIIYGYSYIPGRGFGRSGGGKMKDGGVFRVPPQFSGIAGDNFVTRAFRNRDEDISKALKGLFKWE